MEKSTILFNPHNVEPKKRTFLVPRAIREIVFTDKVAPDGVTTADASEMRDNGVVMWKDGNAAYFSTQRTGVKVTAPENSAGLFSGCTGVQKIDASMLDVSQVKNMNGMFQYCPSLRTLSFLSQWDVSNVTSMSRTFCDCSTLSDIDGLAGWDVSHATNMSSMFERCHKLASVNALQKWDVSRVFTTQRMFFDCTSLNNIDGLSRWDVSRVVNMSSMFEYCFALNDVTAIFDWNVRNVIDMKWMFDKGLQVAKAYPDWYIDQKEERLVAAEGWPAEKPYIPKSASCHDEPDHEASAWDDDEPEL
jgi:surface protein